MTKPLRVVAISRAYGDSAGGMERLSFELLRELRRRPDLELDTIVNTTRAGVSLFQSRLRSSLFALSVIPRALIHARRADVIHLGDPVLSLIGWLIKRFFHKPVAVTVHGLDLTYSNPLYQLYLRWFFRAFDAYLPISSHAAVALRTHHVTGKTHIIHPGVTDRFYDPAVSRQDLKQLLNRSLTGHTILFTSGRLVPRKGHAWFITNVLPHLPANTLYIIAGDGPEKPRLEKLSRANKRVILLGRVSDDSLKTLYNTVDAFIQPNIQTANDTEGFGLVLLEAALCHRPVFASNLEGISNAVTNGRNGTLLPAGDAAAWQTALTAFLKNPQDSPTARKFTLTNFAWPQQTEKYYMVLRQA